MSWEVGIDANDLDVMTEFWSVALGYVRGYHDDVQYRDLVPSDGRGSTVFLQKVDEPKTAKNRVHIDVYDADPRARVERLVGAGATVVGDPFEDGEWWWQVMADPEGNEFCVCRDFPGRKAEIPRLRQ